MNFWQTTTFTWSALTLAWWLGINLLSLFLPNLNFFQDSGLQTKVFYGWFLAWSILSFMFLTQVKPSLRFRRRDILTPALYATLWSLGLIDKNPLWVGVFWLVSFYLLWGWYTFLSSCNFNFNRYWLPHIFLTGVVIISLVSLTLYSISRLINERNAWWGDHPIIEKVEPTVVFPSNKVVIRGKNFGWQNDTTTQPCLKSNQGIVDTDLWTNEKIIFTVPLHWKGEVMIWVEKRRHWKGSMVFNKTNPHKLKVLHLDSVSIEEEDQYLDQVNRASEEVKRLNEW